MGIIRVLGGVWREFCQLSLPVANSRGISLLPAECFVCVCVSVHVESSVVTSTSDLLLRSSPILRCTHLICFASTGLYLYSSMFHMRSR